MSQLRPVFIFIIAFVTGGCMHVQDSVLQRDNQPILTAEHARYRSALITDVSYQIELALDADAPEYTGTLVAEFSLRESGVALSLDFKGGTVYSVEINGSDSDFDYNDAWIGLEARRLQAGKNRVVVHYSHPYSTDGAGLQRTRDTEDGRVYVYTHFEPYDANRLFPCFDQPDLKARYRLAVSAPADWEVVSASSATAITMMSPGIREWEFTESQPFSTYLFALHAGPYMVWEAQAGAIPLRLFARPTLARYVNADEWFELTRNGFDYFQDLFGIPYPFEKYDQLLVPDLNIGAMENVAAVTYNEAYVTRAAPTDEQRQRHAEVLLHEMAHMWFGNLVTPRWWDGLWLKEAFATHVAGLALEATTDLPSPRQRFFAGAKQMGYRADEYESRHPIDVPVDDTHVAFANFDAITYEKGSAALAQLSHYVGAAAFRDGSRRYLQDNSWNSTTLDDFIGAIEASSGTDLQQWKETWLRTAGVNTLTPELHCADGQIRSFTLQQSAPDGVPLREHRLQIALFDQDGSATVIPVSTTGISTTIETAAGLRCPQMSLVNHGDWSFVRTELDARTLKNFENGIGSVTDPLARAMFWQSLWEMVRNANYPLPDYIELVARHAVGESDNLLALQLARTMRSARNLVLRGLDNNSTVAQEALHGLEKTAWQALHSAPAESQLQKTWLEALVLIASTRPFLHHLEAFLDGHRVPAGIDLDTDRRWDIITQLNSFAAGDYQARTDLQALRDKSDRGRKRAIAANVIRPDPAIKRAWLDGMLRNPDFMPLGQLRWGIRALFPPQQVNLRRPYEDEILASLAQLGETRDDAFLRAFSRLIEGSCSEQSVERLEHALGSAETLHPILQRALRNAVEDDRRCLAIARLASIQR